MRRSAILGAATAAALAAGALVEIEAWAFTGRT